MSRHEDSTRTGQLVLMTSTEEFIYSSYNQLMVLHNNFDRVFGSVPLIMEWMGIFFIVLNLFMAVTFRDAASLVKALLMLYIILTYFSCLARVYSSSSEAIQSWREKYYQGLKKNKNV